VSEDDPGNTSNSTVRVLGETWLKDN